MAKRKKARRAKRSRRTSCCPVISIRCKAGAPGAAKQCTVRVAGSKVRRMDSNKAGALVARLVRAQKKRRCAPVVRSRGA